MNMNSEDKLKLSRNVAIIAGLFSVTIALLLLLNYIQMTRSKPLDSEALAALVQQLNKDPNNDHLKAEIRNFDLLARKAYFNTQWQVHTGGQLLLFGTIILIIALRIYYSLKSKIAEPDVQTEDEFTSRLLAQRWVMIVGGIIFALGIGASWLSSDHIARYQVDESKIGASTVNNTNGIEIIEVGRNPQVSQPVAGNQRPQEQAVVAQSTNQAQVTKNVSGPATDKEATASKELKAPAEAVANFPGSDAVKINSPSFRGPFGNGVSYHKNIPVEFDVASGKNIIWKVPVPKNGFNSPVIWGNKVFLAGADNQTHEVYCFDHNSGKLLWKQQADKIQGSPASAPKVSEDTGLSASSLTTDGNMVYAIFANGDIICFDMEGKRIWARNLGMPDNHYGHASSLIMWKDKVYVQYDNNKSHKLIALNYLTGATLWETDRKVKISWASPIIAEINGKYQVILSSDPLVAGYDVDSGKELWNVSCLSGEVGSSPAFGSGLVFAANEYAKLAAIDPLKKSVVWENDEYLPEVASPVVANGLLFLGTSYGVLVCYDAKTGKKYWEKEDGPGFYSSPVVTDNKLFTIDTNGKMRVYEAAKEMKLLGESDLGEKMTTTPAFAEGKMFIRTPKFLYCIGSKI
jgi:outer membrane protein assembly factor BamB